MVHVDDFLAAPALDIDARVFLATAPCEAVQAKQVAVGGLHNVFLGSIAVQLAELDKVGRGRNRRHHGLVFLPRTAALRRREPIEQPACEPVAQFDNGRGQGESNESYRRLESDEKQRYHQREVLADVQPRQERDVRHSGAVTEP